MYILPSHEVLVLIFMQGPVPTLEMHWQSFSLGLQQNENCRQFSEKAPFRRCGQICNNPSRDIEPPCSRGFRKHILHSLYTLTR